MPPVGHFAKRIAFNRLAARRLHGASLRRHRRAVVLGRMALAAQGRGHHVRAARLMRRALFLKAAAVRARVRALRHFLRAVQLRRLQAHRLRAVRPK
jgi:hypothetical protein